MVTASVLLCPALAAQAPTPLTTLGYVKASNGEAGDSFGGSVDVSGPYVVVGAPNEDSAIPANPADNGAASAGAVYVFFRLGASIVPQAYLKAPTPVLNGGFGGHVAIAEDVIVVAAPGELVSTIGPSFGAAYVYRRAGGVWEFEERFVKQQVGQSTGFARGVAAASGVICVGGAGSADIYEWDGSGWMHIQTLDCPVQPPPPLFGVNVAITESFAVVGSDDEDGQAGAVYIYARESGWSFEERLTSPNPDSGDRFGWAVAATGDRLVVGAPGEDGPACGTGGTPAGNGKPNAGACYVFRRGDAGWGLVTYLKGSNCDAGDGFGWGVDASDDWVLVGAIQEDGSSSTMNGASTLNDLPSAGAGYLFHVATTGAATQVAYMKATNPGLGDFAGSSVALDSGLAVLSTPNEDGPVLGGVGNPLSDSASNAGAAYAFDVNVWQGFSGCAAPAMSDVLLLAHSVAAKVGVVVELAAVDVLQAEGVTLLYVGAWGGDGFGCGVMIPGLGEVLLALSPTPVLVSFVASTSGYTDLAVGLPWDPALVGLQIAFQAARVTDDPGLPSLALSDALVTRIVP